MSERCRKSAHLKRLSAQFYPHRKECKLTQIIYFQYFIRSREGVEIPHNFMGIGVEKMHNRAGIKAGCGFVAIGGQRIFTLSVRFPHNPENRSACFKRADTWIFDALSHSTQFYVMTCFLAYVLLQPYLMRSSARCFIFQMR